MSIEELDATVRAFYEGRGDTQKQAQATLNQFKENPDAWLLVDKILQDATYPQTKYLGLQVLDNVIMTRWKVLPRDQCMGIRNFVVNFIIQTSSSEESLRSQRTLVNKLNLVLVSILKQEWPHNWPTFINEIISSCHSSLPICENNMAILRLLSEEVFDYSADQMTSTKTKELKQSMCDEFTSIYQLCSEILRTAIQASLIKATLETLLRFLNWIPLGYIFETPPSGISLIETLRSRFLEVPDFRNITLKCLTEIASLHTEPAYNEKLVQMFTETLTAISKIIPLSLDLRTTYASSNSRDQEFVQNLALFLCNFFTMHLNVSLSTSIMYQMYVNTLTGHREPPQSRLPRPWTFLSHPHKPNRRQGDFQDLLGVLDKARPRAVRRDAAIADRRHEPASEHGAVWLVKRRCAGLVNACQLSLAQAQVQ